MLFSVTLATCKITFKLKEENLKKIVYSKRTTPKEEGCLRMETRKNQKSFFSNHVHYSK